MRDRTCTRIGRIALAAIAVCTMAASAPVPSCAETAGFDRDRFVGVDELRPGDRCVGRTVLSGTEIIEFDVEIVGVVRGGSPGSDVIVGRAEGPAFERAGIMHGMSGSPVYLDGRLVGAFSSAWGFSKEPIGGITPIGEMLPALDLVDAPDAAAPTRVGLGGAARLLPESERASSRAAWLSEVAGVAREVRSWEAAPALFDGRALSPIAAPLLVSGSNERFLRGAAGVLDGSSLVPVIGGGSAEGAVELEPGSAVGVQFVRGDANWTAIGTVTLVDGDRLLAFGHPLFNSGRIEMPMVGATVHAVLPLQTVSLKYASGTDLVGTMVEDRSRTVAGVIGPSPAMLPVRVRVTSPAGIDRVFDFEVVRTKWYAATFTGLAVAGAVSEALQSSGAASTEIAVKMSTDGSVIEYANTFDSTSPAFRTGGEVAALVEVVLLNGFEERTIDSIEVEVGVTGGRRRATIERVSTDRRSYRPGETVRVSIGLRTWQGELVERSAALEIPASAPDEPLVLRVGGASDYHAWESDRLGDGLAPRSYEQILDLIERSLPENTIVAQLAIGEAGIALSGREMKSLPGKAALVMGQSRVSGAVDRVEQRELARTEIVLDRAVSGHHELEITVATDQ